MALLHEAVKDKKFDTRVVERNVAKGVVTTEDVRKAVDALPDDSENAQYVAIDSFWEGDPSEGKNAG